MFRKPTQADFAPVSVRAVFKRALKYFAPPPDLKTSEWADKYRRLTGAECAMPGKWRTDNFPYLREVMDAPYERGVTELVFMASSQVGKTEAINNIMGRRIHLDPAGMLMVLSKEGLAKDWSKDRLMPMLRSSAVFRGLIDLRDRSRDNTQTYKKFPGGYLKIVSANSASDLSSRPVRDVYIDEEDRYPGSVDNEGDPASLAKARSRTFWNRLFVAVSSPTDQTSKIAKRYENSDKRRYEVPCPHCDHYQFLEWKNIVFYTDDKGGLKGDVYYKCEGCGTLLREGDKRGMLRGGRWVKGAESKGIAGFYINTLYSPVFSWRDMVKEFLTAKGDPNLMRSFTNTMLGEIWIEETERYDHELLLQRKEHFGDTLPAGVVLLTCGVDVQADRIEAEIVGWGIGEESWSISYHVLHGDPAKEDVWQQLTQLLKSPFLHKSGVTLRISATCVDTGSGGWTEHVYRYCRKNRYRRVFGIKGASEHGKPLVGRAFKAGKPPVKIHPVGTDTAKHLLFANLRLDMPGPGYCHFPAERETEWFFQLAESEEIIKKKVKGRTRMVWAPIKSRRNEALDCRVYAMAALGILAPNLEGLAEALQDEAAARRKAPAADIPDKEPKSADTDNNGGWIDRQENWI